MNKEKWIERCADALDELSDKEASDFMFNEYGQMLADRWRDYSVIDLKEELELIKNYKKKKAKITLMLNLVDGTTKEVNLYSDDIELLEILESEEPKINETLVFYDEVNE